MSEFTYALVPGLRVTRIEEQSDKAIAGLRKRFPVGRFVHTDTVLNHPAPGRTTLIAATDEEVPQYLMATANGSRTDFWWVTEGASRRTDPIIQEHKAPSEALEQAYDAIFLGGQA